MMERGSGKIEQLERLISFKNCKAEEAYRLCLPQTATTAMATSLIAIDAAYLSPRARPRPDVRRLRPDAPAAAASRSGVAGSCNASKSTVFACWSRRWHRPPIAVQRLSKGLSRAASAFANGTGLAKVKPTRRPRRAARVVVNFMLDVRGGVGD